MMSRSTRPRRRTMLPAVVVALLVALSLPAAASATVREVSLSGTDNAGCATPCRHIAYAVTQTAVGDTVDVGSGTFNEAQIVIDKPMTITGQGPGQTIVNGQSVVTGNGGLFYANNPSVGDITIEGFTLEGGIKNNTNPNPEPFLINTNGVPAGGTLTISNNLLLENSTVDPNLGADYSIGAYVSNSGARLTMTDNRFTGMFQGTLIENHAGPSTIAGNDFDALLASDCEQPPLDCSQGAGSHYPDAVFYLNYNGTNAHLQSIQGNTFHNTDGQPITLNAGIFGPGGLTNVEIIGNKIDGRGATDSTGRPPNAIHIAVAAGGVINNVRILGNDISMSPGPARGEIFTNESGGGSVSGVVAHFNRIRGDADFGVQNKAAATLDATENWWGCNGGPGASGCTTAGGSGGAVDTDPHLVLGVTAAPSSVLLNQSSAITASLTRDSDGNTPPGNVFPAGVPVSFSTDLGTMTPANTTTSSPLASSTFASGSAGTANVSGTIDSQTVSTAVTVTGPAAAPAAAPGETPLGVPTISFATPAENATLGLGSKTPVTLNVNAPAGVQSVGLSYNGRSICTRTAAPFTCQFKPSAADAGRQGGFTAVVTDAQGRAAAATRTVVVGGPATLGSHTGEVSNGLAHVRVNCARFGPCRGTLRIRARYGGRGAPLVNVGSASFHIAAGSTRTIRVDVSRRAKRRLAQKGFLGTRTTVKTGDISITRNLVLHPR
jgi:hypothetical protein